MSLKIPHTGVGDYVAATCDVDSVVLGGAGVKWNLLVQ